MLLFILYYLRVVKTALVLMSCCLIRPSAAERSNTPGTESACLCSAVDLSGAPGGNVLLRFPCCTAAAPTGSTHWKELKSEFRVEALASAAGRLNFRELSQRPNLGLIKCSEN